MHVGLVVYDGLDETSGGYRYDRKLVEYLESQGDTVEVLTIPRQSYARNLVDSVSISLRERLDRPFDVLVQDGLCHPSLVRHTRALEEPTAVVALVHLLRAVAEDGVFAPVYRAIESRYLGSVDGVVCTSQHTRERVRALADTPSTVAYPAGRAEGAALTPEEVTARAHNGSLRILFLGSIVERKGPGTLLSALDSLDGEWTATFVGRTDADTAHAAHIRDRIDGSPHADRIEFRGAVPDDELHDLLERSHVLALPSRYESFGMAYLEAMEYGVVPLATIVGGPREFVHDGVSGRLLPPGDAESLGVALSRLDDDREYLATLANGALETAADHPTWTESMADVRSFLVECADRSAGGGEPP